MGHDTHFLSRLERVEGPALDLALGLYRDSELLRWALKRLPLSDRTDVVALPLSPGPEPPYALVSRKGKFITCLAEGMRPGASEVIRWEQLDGATGEWQAWRELQARGPDRAEILFKRMLTIGPWLPREDFEDLQVIAALKPAGFIKAVGFCADTWLDLQDTFRPRDYHRLDDEKKQRLSQAWKHAWASSHALVATTEARLHIESIRPGSLDVHEVITLATAPGDIAIDGLIIRSGWAMNRLGARILPIVGGWVRGAVTRELGHGPDLSESPGWTSEIAGLYGLLALGARDPEHRAEVMDLLHSSLGATLEGTEGQNPFELVRTLISRGTGMMATTAAAALRHLEEADANFPTSRRALRSVTGVFLAGKEKDEGTSKRLPAGPPRRPGVPEKTVHPSQVPADFVIPHELLHVPPFGLYGSMLVKPVLAANRLHVMPALAGEPPSGLFFSRLRLQAMSDRLQLTTPVEVVRDLLTAKFGVMHTLAAPKPSGPGRNESCTCGSGRKYKKCCGR